MSRKHTLKKGVYCLTFPNGKRYVGIGMSRDGIAKRFGQYRRLDQCIRGQRALFSALKKYGAESVRYDTVLITQDAERAKSVERQLIALWNTTSPERGYNITFGGDGWLGCKHSESHIEKMRTINTGRKHTDASKAKMSSAHAGREPWNKGRPHPAASRARSHEEIMKGVISRYGNVSWQLLSPIGVIVCVPMLSTFCKENKLSLAHMKATMSGDRSHHKGWRVLGKTTIMTPVEG